MADAVKKDHIYDAVVIGGGPAGLTAAIYLSKARYRVIVVEKEQIGGQIAAVPEVVNYAGVERVSGKELTETMRRQAQEFGAEFLMAEAQAIVPSGKVKRVRTGRGELACFGILLATGARPKTAGFSGEKEFRGRGVAYSAACDGDQFSGKEVFVVGGGHTAARESVFLAKYASHVTVLLGGEDFKCGTAAADAAKKHEKITVLKNIEVQAVEGDTALRLLRYKDTVTGRVTEYHAKEGQTFGIFVFRGYEPAADLVRGIARLSEHGYIITDGEQRTNADGIFAAGDVCVKNLRRVATAVGDGAAAAAELERYALAMQQKAGVRPVMPEKKEK